MSGAASPSAGGLALAGRASGRSRPLPLPQPWAVTAVLGAVYVILAPPSSDLAAAAYRSDLFSRVGFTLWDNSWYGGHHLPAYSLLAPALGALLTPQLVAALGMTAATALFSALIAPDFAPRVARIAGLWLAVGASVGLLSNRVPFDLGLGVGLGALVLAQRRHHGGALCLAVLTPLASPVDGAFLALACVAWALAGTERARAVAMVLAALAPIALLAAAFPEGGTQPFVASAFYPALAGVLAIAWLTPPDQPVLRAGALLYALALTGAYVLPTAVGANADRLGALFGAPVFALLLLGGSRIGRRPRLLLALSPVLLYWQVNAPVSDFAAASSDPAVNSSYYAPLVGELGALGIGDGSAATRPARIEVVPVTDHWEARWMAPHVMLARGWERQLDQYRNGVFYEGALTPARYRSWLSEQAVSYIALPDAVLDYSAVEEARLLRGEIPGAHGRPPAYLREVWRSPHWRLFAVLGATPLVAPPASLPSVGTDSFTLRAPAAGAYTVRLRFTPYWAASGGGSCVEEAPGDWTRVSVKHAGEVHVGIAFSLARVLHRGPRCA